MLAITTLVRLKKAQFDRHQNAWEQGEWLRQNCIIRPATSGAGRTTLSQTSHYPLANIKVSKVWLNVGLVYDILE